jgi:Ca-activated chloride channel homolog
MARTQAYVRPILSILLCLAPSLNGQDTKPKVPLFKVSVNTVFVKVVVTDPWNRNVTGLKKEDFNIYEDNINQTISHFSQQSAPVSVGFVFDISGSMVQNRHLGIGKNWFSQLLKTGDQNPEDEYFLITFSQKINLVQAFTSDRLELQYELAMQRPGGWTALYDAVYFGIDKIKDGRNEKKALVLISDGGENRSRYKLSEVRELATESDVQIYAIGVDPSGYSTLKSIADLTGGRAFNPGYADIDYYISLIHTELRNQYLLGYVPTNDAKDGKWRRVAVKVNKPPGYPKLSIRARDGYRAPQF